MKLVRTIRAKLLHVVVTTAVTACLASAQTTEPSPTTQQTDPKVEALKTDFLTLRHQLFDAMGDPEQLSDPEKRQVIAPNAIPVLKKMLADLNELEKLDPEFKASDTRPQRGVFGVPFGAGRSGCNG